MNAVIEWVVGRAGRIACAVGVHNLSCRGRRDHCAGVGKHGGRHKRPLWTVALDGSMTSGGRCIRCGAA